MKVFTQKRILLIPVLVFLIAAIMAIAIPAVASTPESYYGVQVSMGGNVSINYLYTDLGDADSVVVIVRDSAGTELSRNAIPIDEITQNDDGRYVISTKLAAAEMTNYVTVYTQKNGVKLGERHTYSVKTYAAEVLANEEYSEYHAAIKAMLNYGAMAQAHFGVNTNDLANSDVYRGTANPISAVTDIDCAKADWTDGATLKFGGYEAVLESATAFRIYFTYSGSGNLFATVEREGVSAQKSAVYRDSANGRYYVKINNIGATLYDKQYTVKVTDGSDDLSVSASILNYVDTVLVSSDTTKTQKNAVRAMYNHYVWTANAAPQFTDCAHAYTHTEAADANSATDYVCSTCGVSIKKVPDSVEIYKSPIEIAGEYTRVDPLQVGELMTDADGTVFARIHGGNSKNNYNTYRFYGHGAETGKYLVIKYRLPSDNHTPQSTMHWFVKSNATGSAFAKCEVKVSEDNKWHIIVVDLDQMTDDNTGFMPNADGKYYANDMWFRPLSYSKQGTTEDTMDIAYIAMCNDLSDVSELIDETTYERHVSKTVSTLVTTATNECLQHNVIETRTSTACSYECGFCDKDFGVFDLSDINYFCSAKQLADFGVTSSRPIGDHYSYSTTYHEENGVIFARMLYNDEHYREFGGSSGQIYVHGDYHYNPGKCEDSTGRFLVLKIRNTGNTQYKLEISSTGGTLTGSANKKAVNLGTANRWETVVVDLAAFANYSAYDTSENAGICCRITSSGSIIGEDYIDIAYCAIVDDLNEAKQIIGNEETYNYYANINSWATNGVTCNTSTMSCRSECTKKEIAITCAGGKYYIYSCTTCGHYYSTRKFVSNDINWYVTPQYLANKYSYANADQILTDDDGTEFVRMIGGQGSGTYNTLPLGTPGTSLSVGQYYVVKYRLSADNPTKHELQHFFTRSTNAVAGKYDKITYQVHSDGEWHIVVIAIDDYTSTNNYYPNETDGLYYTDSLWMRPLTDGSTGSGIATAEDYIDYAYVALCDTLEDVAELAGDENYELHYSSAGYRVIDPKTGKCAIHNYVESNDGSIYKMECTDCGHVYAEKNIANINKFVSATDTSKFTTLYMPTGNSFPTLETEYNKTTGEYVMYSSHTHNYKNTDGTPKNSEGHMYFFGSHVTGGLLTVPIDRAGQYLVLKFRTFEVSKMVLQARTGDNAYNGSITRTTGFNNGWETVIIDLSEIASYEVGAENTTFSIRMQVFRAATADPAQTVQVAYAAIVDNLDEAAQVIGNDDVNLYTSWSKAPTTYTKTDVACSGSILGHTTANATCTSDRVCDACGITYAEPAGHQYTENRSAQTIASYATADTPATYYKSCVCGKLSDETFTYGKTLNEMVDYTKVERYESIASGITNGEKFLFFTDPHYVTAAADGIIGSSYDNAIGIMGMYYDKVGASFTLCGGDWFNNSNTRENALFNMADINSRMEAAFGDNFYLAVGNHDYNYQTKKADGTGTTSSPHWLTRDELDSAWFSDERYGGKSYYSFSGENTKFYVFDSGIDWSHSAMTDLDKEQVEWFLNELLKNDDAHIALAPHMLYTSGTTLNPGTAKFLEIAEIYNNRGTVAYNGKLYDFADKTGRVEFLIAGHTHIDEVSVYNGIACILTVNNGVNCPSFDLVAVDYDERVIHLVRVSSATTANAQTLDRVVSLDIAE